MTNEELIKRFFREQTYGDEESYGFSVKPCPIESVCVLALFSKASQFPIASKAPKGYFILSPPHVGVSGNHGRLTIGIAKQMKIKFILSPKADKANFQEYMEGEINRMLSALAKIIKGHPLGAVLAFEVKYKLLLEDTHTLLDGEIKLGLPKNQVVLLDTPGVQDLWKWLIKDNPNKEERELLRKIYMLSRLMTGNKK